MRWEIGLGPFGHDDAVRAVSEAEVVRRPHPLNVLLPEHEQPALDDLDAEYVVEAVKVAKAAVQMILESGVVSHQSDHRLLVSMSGVATDGHVSEYQSDEHREKGDPPTAWEQITIHVTRAL